MTTVPLDLSRAPRDEGQAKSSGLATTLLLTGAALGIAFFWLLVLLYFVPMFTQ